MSLFNQVHTLISHDSNIHNIQVKIHSTIEHNMITQEFSTKSYNVQNSNKNKQQQNDNVSTPSSQQNIKLTNLPTKKPKKKKNELTLKSFLECGEWVLGS